MRRLATWVVASSAAVGAALAALAIDPVTRAEAGDAPSQEKAFAAVRKLLQTLTTTKAGPVPGTPKAQALRHVASWSAVIDDWAAPLEKTPYSIGQEWKGVVSVYLGEKKADDLTIHILLPGVDRAAMRAFVARTLETLNFEVEDDDENRWSCWGTSSDLRTVWIGVGEGILTVEVSSPA